MMKNNPHLALGIMVVTSMLMSTRGDSHCYSTETNPYYYFAAKTLYVDSVPKDEAIPPSTDECTPRLFYLLIRHGTRYPSRTDFNNMIKYLPDLRRRIMKNSERGDDFLCKTDLNNLSKWKQRIREEDVDDLAQTGVEEMKFIARKYQDAFPKLLKKPYNEDNHLFQSSYMERNIRSAKEFAKALSYTDAKIQNNPKGNDSLLQFYKNCEETKKVRQQPMPQREKLIEGHITNVTIPAIQNFLGFKNEALSFDQIDAMYKMCVFDHVVFEDSPWCAAFSRQNLITMEYLEDLRNYYLEGPGHQINIDQSCDLLKDVVKYLRMPREKPAGNHPTGVFRFTHSPVINSFLAQLGLFKGQTDLLSNNMAEQEDRKWRLSLLDPYSAHVGFAVEECRDSKFKLRTYVNGKLNQDLDWNTVMDLIGDKADNCDFGAICEDRTSGHAEGYHPSYAIFALLYVFLRNICL